MTSIFLNLAASDTFNKDQLPHTPVKAALLWIFLDIFSQRGCQHDHFHLYHLYEKKKRERESFKSYDEFFPSLNLLQYVFNCFNKLKKYLFFMYVFNNQGRIFCTGWTLCKKFFSNSPKPKRITLIVP